MSTFYSVTTHIGDAKIANAVALGQQVGITHLAVGDGNGVSVLPLKDKTSLVHEVYRAQINSLTIDEENPNYFIATLVIPPEVGGFTIREAAVFTQDGTLFAVANFPETYKPTLPEGGVGELTVQFYFAVVSPEVVQIVVDPYVTIATRAWVLANFYTKSQCNDLFESKLSQRASITTQTPSVSGWSYTIFNSVAVSLPPTDTLTGGEFVRFRKAHTAIPQISVSNPDTEIIETSQGNDTTVIFDIDAEVIFVFNQLTGHWEV